MISTKTPIRFTPFNDALPMRYYQTGYLPHLRQRGCTYFVTFRLADSVPVPRLEQWKQERAIWLIARNIDVREASWKLRFLKLSQQDKQTYERNFASKLFETLDEGFGKGYLKRQDVQNKMVQALEYFDGSRFRLGDFVIMPNHVHVLMTPIGEYELEVVLHSIKSWSGSQINRMLERSGEFWMKDSFDRLVRDGDELLRVQDYIRQNPKKANLSKGEFHVGTREYVLRF